MSLASGYTRTFLNASTQSLLWILGGESKNWLRTFVYWGGHRSEGRGMIQDSDRRDVTAGHPTATSRIVVNTLV